MELFRLADAHHHRNRGIGHPSRFRMGARKACRPFELCLERWEHSQFLSAREGARRHRERVMDSGEGASPPARRGSAAACPEC
jgi:hypothetical protein